MLLNAAVRLASTRGVNTFSHSTLQNTAHRKMLSVSLSQAVRGFARETRFVNKGAGIGAAARQTKTRTWKEIFTQPTTGSPFVAGKMFLAGCSGLGLGALCYYGLGLSNQVGTFDTMGMWPQYVRDRVHSTYAYFAGSLAVTAAAAVQVARTPALMNLVMKNGWMSLIATFAVMIGTGALCRSIEYEGGIGVKHAAWLLHCAVLGGIVAPLTLLGGPILMRAAWYTLGVVGGMSTVAMCAPSEKFLNMGGVLGAGLGVVLVSGMSTVAMCAPSEKFLNMGGVLGAGLGVVLVSGMSTVAMCAPSEKFLNMGGVLGAGLGVVLVSGMSTVAMCAPSEKFLNMGGVLGAGLGVVLVSSIGTWFLPPTTALGAGLYSVAIYGGLALFAAFLLYDTQRIVKTAEAYPPNALKKYDPINQCLSIYLDTLNIFIRIAMILSGGGMRRK